MFTTTADYVKATTDYFSAFPKTPEEIKTVLGKTKTIFETEIENGKEVVKTYSKVTKGEATMKDIAAANKKAQELFVATRFAAIMAMPGALFALPVLSKLADEYSFDLVPASVKREFNI
jgi:hypothetical protein